MKDISDWIERISKVQKYGHPICPYAKKAKYLICENEDYKSIELKACFWTTDYDILVCIPTDKYMSVERAKQIEWNCNRLAKDTITLLDHPKDPGYIDGVFTGNGKHIVFLIQPKKDILIARKHLRSTSYYNNWSDEYYKKITNHDKFFIT